MDLTKHSDPVKHLDTHGINLFGEKELYSTESRVNNAVLYTENFAEDRSYAVFLPHTSTK